MIHRTRIRNMAILCFGAASVLFLIFFIYMSLWENTAVYNPRDSYSYTTVEDCSEERITDDSAPLGIRTVYRWRMDTYDQANSSLCFYLVHHYAHVYYGDELVYSLTGDSNNRIGDSTSSNWVTVPFYPEDAGKEITIVLTPLFESVAGDKPEFLIGSHYSIVFGQLTKDLPQLFISMLCIFVGIFIIAMQLYFNILAKVKVWDMFFIGSFSIILGFWRITDTKSSPLLFSANPMVLGYITIGVLFLCSIPLLLFASTYFQGKKSTLLQALAAAASVIAVIVLLLQVLDMAEFKEMLTISHITLIAGICAIIGIALFRKKRDVSHELHKSWKLFLLPIVGIVTDMVLFYIKGSSSDIFYTLIAVIVYALVVFILSLLETTKKAYMDSGTGLTNKIRWNELMNTDAPIAESTAIMMMDLNGLKKVNDTWGHDAGDRMILSFSNILRDSLPKNSVICRWGGDEFAIMITGIGKKKAEECMDAVRQAVDDYNAVCDEPPICYAAGCVLSSDYPDLSRTELLNEADSQMYHNKRKWYSERKNAEKND